MKKKIELDRRLLLKGAGVSLALPLLEAMIPKSALAQSTEKPIIINCIWPNGLPGVIEDSEKERSGYNTFDETWQVNCNANYATNHYLNRLSPLAKSMSSVIPNSSHEWDGSFSGHESMCGIYAGNAGAGRYNNFGNFLSGRSGERGGDPNLLMSESYDQRIARHFGLKSINAIGAKGYYGSPYSNEAQGRKICDPISWERNLVNGQFDGTHRPLHVFEDIYQIYDEIVGKQTGSTSDSEKLARRQLLINKDTILSKIMSSITNLNKNLGSSDKRILEEYLQGVRDIDSRVAEELSALDGAPTTQTCSSSSGRPASVGDDNTHENMEKRVRLIQDLYTLAMECDVFQVFGLNHAGRAAGLSMYGQGGSGWSWHSVSHWRFTDGGDAVVASGASQLAQRRRYAEFATKQITLFADWMNRLAEKKQVNGRPFLEKVSATLTTDISDGNNHSRHGIPVYMAGLANGKIPKHNGHQFSINKHCTYLENGTWWHGFHKAEIWLAILQQLGVPENSFGMSSRALPGFNQGHS